MTKHWRTEELQNICEIVVGRTPSRSRRDYWTDGSHRWLSIADMNQGKFIHQTKEGITDLAALEAGCRQIPAYTVLLSFKLSIGKVSVSKVPLYTNEAIAALPIKDNKMVDLGFLYWALRSMNLSDGGNRAAMGITLNKSALQKLCVPMPPIDEQRQIARVLDQVDALRAKRREALVRLDQFSQSIFLDMFHPRRRISSMKLGEALSFVTSGGRGWAKYYSDNGRRFIRSLDVRMNRIENAEAVYVNPPSNAEARRTEVHDGDVLLTITGSRIGRVSTVNKDLAGAYISQHVAILRPLPERIRPQFLSYFLSLESAGQRQIKSAQYGQTKPGLNLDQIRAFVIPAPTLYEQDKFICRATAVERLKAKQRAHLVELDALFESLQHRAFRGEL